MNEDKHIIWSNYDLDYEDWRGDLEAEYPELSEDERISLMYEINGHYLDITRVTRRLGDDIAKVYGFSIPRQRQAATIER